MSSQNAFTPQGNTVTFTANVSAPTAVQALGLGLGPTQYIVQNTGTATVFLGYGSSTTLAAANAATVTTTGPSIPLLANTVQVFTLPPNQYFTGVASSAAVVYITPGEGA